MKNTYKTSLFKIITNVFLILVSFSQTYAQEADTLKVLGIKSVTIPTLDNAAIKELVFGCDFALEFVNSIEPIITLKWANDNMRKAMRRRENFNQLCRINAELLFEAWYLKFSVKALERRAQLKLGQNPYKDQAMEKLFKCADQRFIGNLLRSELGGPRPYRNMGFVVGHRILLGMYRWLQGKKRHPDKYFDAMNIDENKLEFLAFCKISQNTGKLIRTQ